MRFISDWNIRRENAHACTSNENSLPFTQLCDRESTKVVQEEGSKGLLVTSVGKIILASDDLCTLYKNKATDQQCVQLQ